MNSRTMMAFCSWSGGKDSCLALHRARQEGWNPRYLFTMFTEGGKRSRSHGLDIAVVRAQADALGMPLLTAQATWLDYEEVFLSCLGDLKQQNITAGIFGDIDIAEHLAWVKSVCRQAGLAACLPLWHEDRRKLVDELISLGYRAVVVAAREELTDLLGRDLDQELIAQLVRRNVDPCGEQGEFHTVVVDGPLFSRPIRLEAGEKLIRAGYTFLDFKLAKLRKAGLRC